jgi:Putative methyltransferase
VPAPDAPRDWADWHRPYDDSASLLSGRLRRVQAHLRLLLDRQPPGPVQVISLCAGQGRDVIGVLEHHPRRADVGARLVELDPRNVEHARRAAAAAGLDGVHVTEADAGLTDSYAGAVPAQIVVACGIFGNITDADIERTVTALPGLCAPGAGVIWTRHTRAPDLTPAIRAWLAAAGFAEEAYEAPAATRQGIGRHRLTGPPAPFPPGEHLFTFAAFDPQAGPPGPAP